MDKPTHPADSQATPLREGGPTDDTDLSGQVLDDFKVLRRLGQGGMGQVYLAEQLSLRRQVALKILRPELADSPTAATAATSLARFRAEAEAVARATHASIVQIYAIGRAGGVNYMALEYVEGRNLREYVEKKKPIAVATGLKIMAQVAAALARADELKIVHRDVKPENILLGRKGEVKVADFGLSRCFDRTQDLTRSGVVMGTPLYMSPEQVERTQPADHRSDIYAFGATCYFMFAGQPPFRGDNPIEVAYQHVHKQPEPLAEQRPDLPPDLCALIHKMMAKQPAERYQTAREVGREVARLREQLLLSSSRATLTPSGIELAPPPELLSAPAPAAPALSATAPRSIALPRRRGLRLVLAALGVLLALGGGLAVGWYRQQPAAPSAQPAPPAADEDAAAKALFSAKAQEKELQRQVKEKYRAQGPVNLTVLAGLNAAVELGLLYLEQRRLDEAEAFFKDLCPAGDQNCPGHLLSRLGSAMVFAFRDEPAESNRRFLALAAEFDKLDKRKGPAHKDDLKIYELLWKNTPPAAALREMVARALRHNYENDAKHFPAKLAPYRQPPRPVVKGAA